MPRKKEKIIVVQKTKVWKGKKGRRYYKGKGQKLPPNGN